MFTCTQFRCELCGEDVGCLDEQNRCEQCVLRAELATDLFARLEELVQAAIETGLTERALRDAFELSLTGEEGELPELAISRQATEDDGVEWVVAPYSAWLDHVPDYEPNRIRRLRRMHALSAETVADRLGVAVAELALWEHTPVVPAHIVHQLAEMFGVSVPHLMKTDMDWLQG